MATLDKIQREQTSQHLDGRAGDRKVGKRPQGGISLAFCRPHLGGGQQHLRLGGTVLGEVAGG